MLTPLSSSGAASTLTRKRPLESDPDSEDLNNKAKVRITTGKNCTLRLSELQNLFLLKKLPFMKLFIFFDFFDRLGMSGSKEI